MEMPFPNVVIPLLVPSFEEERWQSGDSPVKPCPSSLRVGRRTRNVVYTSQVQRFRVPPDQHSSSLT